MYVYGLSAYGESGIDKVLRIFRDDFQRTMALLGVKTIGELNASFLERMPVQPEQLGKS